VKLHESGMPEEAYWETLLDVPLTLDRLGIDARLGDVMEFGCGYGTFTVPMARRVMSTPRLESSSDKSMAISDICKTLQISRPTLYRWIAAQPKPSNAS
jgi:hypothetical protein